MSKKKPAQKWYQRHWDKLVFLFLFSLFVLGIPGQNAYTVTASDKGVTTRRLPAIPPPAPYPTNITGIYPVGEITAEGVVVLDIDSGVYLYRRNEEELLSPASTTKILTALVALDHYQLDDIVTVKSVISEGQVMGLVPGERMTVENLLFGALIQSGNDAAWALAEHYPGGVEPFMAKMNEKAQALHLNNSTFTNPVGFDDPAHKMTPMDLARLGSIALNNKTIAKMVAIPQITVSDVTHTYFHPLTNVNQLLGKIPGVGGIKTGWTEEAGENLITLVERGGHRVIIVVLKSLDRFSDTTQLINWVFANYQWQVL
jgi:serine-type D-Ala-D-Ala carboxypeptidase (penicillin-binding protein 5/6)